MRVLTMMKYGENNGTEEIVLVTPIPGVECRYVLFLLFPC